MTRLLLASRGVPGLATVLGAKGSHAILVPDAADPLGDPSIAAEVEKELHHAGLEVTRLNLGAVDDWEADSAVLAADVVAVSGGDPFYLLSVARRVGFGDARATLDDLAVHRATRA